MVPRTWRWLVELQSSLASESFLGRFKDACKFANAQGEEASGIDLLRTLEEEFSLPADFNKYLAKKMTGCNCHCHTDILFVANLLLRYIPVSWYLLEAETSENRTSGLQPMYQPLPLPTSSC